MSFNPYDKQPDKAHMDRIEHHIRSTGSIAMGAFLAVGALAWYLLPLWLTMPGTFEERLRFSIQWSLPILLCLLTAVAMVSTGRRRSAQDVAGSAAGAPSATIAIRVAFLQNTLEQTLLALGAFLVFSSIMEGSWLSLIPMSAAFFVLGRILFFRGYKHGAEGRALGMSLTMLPTTLLYVVALGGWLLSLFR